MQKNHFWVILGPNFKVQIQILVAYLMSILKLGGMRYLKPPLLLKFGKKSILVFLAIFEEIRVTVRRDKALALIFSEIHTFQKSS